MKFNFVRLSEKSKFNIFRFYLPYAQKIPHVNTANIVQIWQKLLLVYLSMRYQDGTCKPKDIGCLVAKDIGRKIPQTFRKSIWFMLRNVDM